MEQAELKKYVKKVGVIGAFFGLSVAMYVLNWRAALVLYTVIISVVLVLMVLIQSGRGGGLASLGGLDTDSLFGTHSATPISKATYVIGFLLIFTCMLAARLGVVAGDRGVLEHGGLELPVPGAMEGGEEPEAAPEGPAPAGEGQGGAAPGEPPAGGS